MEAPKASVTLVRSPAEQAAYEKSLHPGFAGGLGGWCDRGGFALTAGNSETKNLNIGFNGVRTGFHDKLILYTKPRSTPPTSKIVLRLYAAQTTANSNSGGVALRSRDFTPRVFGFGSADFYQQLTAKPRPALYILGGGIGWHAIKHDSENDS